jgi:hypothetical protein
VRPAATSARYSSCPARAWQSALLIGLFFLSFLFDTRLGLVFLAAAVVLLYRVRRTSA